MILRALNQYYQRKSAIDSDSLAPEGFEKKEIPFIIVINASGQFVTMQDTREPDAKKKLRGKEFLVPQGEKKTSGIKANLLWDNNEYVLGIGCANAKLDKVPDRHAAFIQLQKEIFNPADHPALQAMLAFLNNDAEKAKAKEHPLWQEIDKAGGGNMTFRIDGQIPIIAEMPTVQSLFLNTSASSDEQMGICLVTGEEQPLQRLHPSIKGVWGAQTSGANIVSFNADAFRSFDKEQGFNAPVGKPAAFAYTTALNTLLGRESRQRLQIGDASTVFWASEKNILEDCMLDIFGDPPKDDPDRNNKALKSLHESPHKGQQPVLEDSTKFYILGLAPNASRISIRFWIEDTVANVAKNIVQHFEDIKIIHAPHHKETLPLFFLLRSIAVQGKADNIPPNLSGDFPRAVLSGSAYPATMLQAAIRRNRAEQQVTYERAALIKASLIRRYNLEVTVSLNPEEKDIGYNLGRLFATLEKIQGEAMGDINATIRDRYYGAASSTPQAVFSTLMKLKNHHLSKIESKGRAFNLEKEIGNIMNNIQKFPSILALPQQGMFAIGYYHQRQQFYIKKSDQSEQKEVA